jgi:hypothetical protein
LTAVRPALWRIDSFALAARRQEQPNALNRAIPLVFRSR